MRRINPLKASGTDTPKIVCLIVNGKKNLNEVTRRKPSELLAGQAWV